MAKRFTLGKKERLKSRKSIEQLFDSGKKFSSGPFRILYSPAPALQFAVGVGNKHFKKAVDRNRIKRLTREAWRLQKPPLTDQVAESKKAMNVFFVYTSKELPTYEMVYQYVGAAIAKLGKTLGEKK